LREAEAVRQDKGNALREIFERSGARSVFFAGDDLTDFPAIELAAVKDNDLVALFGASSTPAFESPLKHRRVASERGSLEDDKKKRRRRRRRGSGKGGAEASAPLPSAE